MSFSASSSVPDRTARDNAYTIAVTVASLPLVPDLKDGPQTMEVQRGAGRAETRGPRLPQGLTQRLQATLFFGHEIHYFNHVSRIKRATDDRSNTGVFEFALFF